MFKSMPPLVRNPSRTRGGIDLKSASPKKNRAFGAILMQIYRIMSYLGTPAGLLPPEAKMFELFTTFWSDFAVKTYIF